MGKWKPRKGIHRLHTQKRIVVTIGRRNLPFLIDLGTVKSCEIQGMETYRNGDTQGWGHTEMETHRVGDAQGWRNTRLETQEWRHTDIGTYSDSDTQAVL